VNLGAQSATTTATQTQELEILLQAAAKSFVVFHFIDDTDRWGEGGMHDYCGAYETLAAAKKAAPRGRGASHIAEITADGLTLVYLRNGRRWRQYKPRRTGTD
jgi:hypothetical protein